MGSNIYPLNLHHGGYLSKNDYKSITDYVGADAQADLPPFPGRVLLLSLIVGEFDHDSQAVHFSPPLPNRLHDLVAKGQLPCPVDAHIHVGSEDWQSVPANVQALGDAVGIPVHIAPGRTSSTLPAHK